MKHFSLKLRKILLSNITYYLLLLISILYIFIYNKLYIPQKIKIEETYNLKINNYNIDGNKLTLEFNNLRGIYYFEKEEDLDNFKKTYNLGDTIEINGTLETLANNTIPNTFNYKDYLYHKKINYILKIDRIKKVKINKNILLKAKNYILKRIENTKYNSYLYAFILGKSSYIDNESYRDYKINGVTHLFALSGLHVSLFSNIILFILNKLKLNEKVSFIITSIFLIFFSFIASFTPSILRATIFFILSSLNKIYYTFIKPKNILILTFNILVFKSPFYIFDTGFILSFTITYFILLLNENITIRGNIKSILIVSILSFLSSLPIIINLSYEINIIGFINNILFIPLVTNIIFPFSLIVVIIPKLSYILFILTTIMETISKYSSNLLNITFYFEKLSKLEIIIYYILLIFSIKKNKKLLYFLFIFIIILYLKPNLDKNTYVYFIDVSQGDSALIVTKNNKSILIDTGGKLSYKTDEWKQKNKEFNLMTSSIIPFFKSIGLKKIDYLLITHGDADHAGYALELLNNYKVINKYTNKGRKNTLEKKLNINSLDIKYVKIDNIEIYSLNDTIYNNENKDSLVLLIKIYNYKFLFMADADKEVEQNIIEKYNIKNVDVLKVGHHGSKTSTNESFISEITPKYSIISVGKNNKFGHPNTETLDALKDSKILRTDELGTIKITLNKNKSLIETFAP